MRHRLLQLAPALFLAAACGTAPTVTDAPRCLKLTAPDGDTGLVTSAPAKVSLFFGIATCGGEPVSGLTADAFDIEEDGKAVSAFESQRTIEPKGEKFRLDSLLLLDLSGSVLKGGNFPALKSAAEAYAHAVLDRKDDGQRLAVMTFDGRSKPQALVNFTDDEHAVLTGLASLELKECTANAQCAATPDHATCAGWRCVDDSTNLNGAVVAGLDSLDAQLEAEQTIAWRAGALVVFTDGSDEAARVTQDAALTRVKGSAAHVFTVGLGGEADTAALQAFGKDGYFPSADATGLTQAFTSIATQVTSLANRFYLLEYCSPKRDGTHTLKLTATLSDGSKTPLVGDFSGQFDASGFTSGCTLTP